MSECRFFKNSAEKRKISAAENGKIVPKISFPYYYRAAELSEMTSSLFVRFHSLFDENFHDFVEELNDFEQRQHTPAEPQTDVSSEVAEEVGDVIGWRLGQFLEVQGLVIDFDPGKVFLHLLSHQIWVQVLV